jgi:hypothetical protein
VKELRVGISQANDDKKQTRFILPITDTTSWKLPPSSTDILTLAQEECRYGAAQQKGGSWRKKVTEEEEEEGISSSTREVSH